MNKTISINIGGQIFYIDENAYASLETYLGNLKRYFLREEGGDEIVQDIESRIAELFNEKILNSERNALEQGDIDEMIAIMGNPVDIDGEEEHSAGPEPIYSPTPAKRFYRNVDNRVLGGVCSGISSYFGIEEPIWMRLLLVIGVLSSVGGLILLYLVLWIIIPPAETSVEKLAMRGENATVGSIENSVRTGIQKFQNSVEEYSTGPKGQEIKSAGTQFGAKLEEILFAIVRFMGKFGKYFLAAILGVILISLVLSFFSAGAGLWVGFGFLHDFLLESKFGAVLGFLSLFAIIGLPIIGLSVLIGSLLSKNGVPHGGKILAGTALCWIVAICLFGFVVAKEASSFKQQAKIERSEILSVNEEPLKIELIDENLVEDMSDENHPWLNDAPFSAADNQLFVECVLLDIKRGTGSEFELITEIESNGRSRSDARKRAEMVQGKHQLVNGSTLQIAPYYMLVKGQKFRAQKVQYTLLVPEGREIVIAKSARQILEDLDRPRGYSRNDLIDIPLMMGAEHFDCENCPEPTRRKTKENATVSYRIKDPKGPVEKTIELSNFENIEISGVFDIAIEAGDEYQVFIQGHEDEVEMVDFDQDGKTLKIDMETDDDGELDINLRSFNRTYLRIVTPQLEELELEGANEAVVSGYGVGDLELSIRGASKCSIYSDFNELDVDIEGAAYLNLKGSADLFTAKLMGACRIAGEDFDIQDCVIEMEGVSSADLSIEGSLDAKVSPLSKLNYDGKPKMIRPISFYTQLPKNKSTFL